MFVLRPLYTSLYLVVKSRRPPRLNKGLRRVSSYLRGLLVLPAGRRQEEDVLESLSSASFARTLIKPGSDTLPEHQHNGTGSARTRWADQRARTSQRTPHSVTTTFRPSRVEPL